MDKAADILLLDGTDQAAALAAGRLTSEQLVITLLAAIEDKNPELNCFLVVDPDTALSAARASDFRRAQGTLLSPVDGLTVAVKDNIDVAGFPTTAGLGTELKTSVEDAPVIASLRAAGAILLGKLNMDEAAVGTDTNNPHHGRCHNPSYPGRVPGGSSGGSGSAVAAGLCAMALGTDTMGSVRIPASCCGIVGMKPSAKTVSNAGSVPCARRLDTIGPLCRSSRDLDLWLPLMNQSDPTDFTLRSPAPAYQPARCEKHQLNIGVIPALKDSVAMSAAVESMYDAAIQSLSSHIESLQQITIDAVDFGKIRRAGLIAVEADLAVEFDELLLSQPQAISPGLSKMLHWLKQQPATTLAQAHHHIDDIGCWIRSLLANTDALLLPTVPVDIPACDDPVPAGISDLTAPINMAGLPAVSFPVGHDAEGLPLSLQLVGRWGNDAQLVAMAKTLSETLSGLLYKH